KLGRTRDPEGQRREFGLNRHRIEFSSAVAQAGGLASTDSLPIIPYTEQTAYEHARIWAALEVSGKMIGFNDLIVGATALERGSEVATFNKRHFGQIRGLGVIEPK